MLIGYARCSTADQNLDWQLDALKDAGCERIYEEKISGTKKDRPELNRMLDAVREGDMVIVCELTRLSRSTKDLHLDMANPLFACTIGHGTGSKHMVLPVSLLHEARSVK